jgi:hypothetical protein
MNKSIFRALCALSFFVLFSCNSKENTSTEVLSNIDSTQVGETISEPFFEEVNAEEMPEAGEGEIILSFNPEKGKKYSTKMQTVTNIKQSMLDQSFSSVMDIATTNSILVKENIPGSSVTLSSQVHSFKAMMKQDTMVAGFESGKESDNAEIDMMRKILDCYIDMPIEITMDGNAELITVDGIQAVQDKIAEQLGQEAVMASMQMSDMNQEIVNSFVSFPKQPVKIGDVWNTVDSVDMGGFPAVMINSFTLKGFDDQFAWVDVYSDFKIDKAAMQALGATGDEVTMTGYQKGTMKVEKSSGWSMASDLSQKIQMKMDAQGQQMSISIDGTSTLVTTKK